MKKTKAPQWASDLERTKRFDQIVTLVCASRVLREHAMMLKKELLKASGWTSRVVPSGTFRHPKRTRETWTTPDKSRTYYFFDAAWMCFARKMRAKPHEVDKILLAKVLELREAS